MRIEALRKLAGGEEIDYQFLIAALQNYSHPRDKISNWLKAGDLIRVKKGLYVFGKHIAHSPFSQEILANLIYGPSAISLSYALALYGLIPERASTVTNITHKRYKNFTTPVGTFIYYYLSPQKYTVGIELKTTASNRQFLIASPEKALCDQIIIIDKNLSLSSEQSIEDYLFSDMRIDEHALRDFNMDKLLAITKAYKNKNLEALARFLTKWKK
jgi:hypothetical protein